MFLLGAKVRLREPIDVRKSRKVMVMTVQFSRQGMAAMPLASQIPQSSFVRRLLQANNDPAKQRVLAWLLEIDDARLLGFGLTPEDIVILRATGRAEEFCRSHSRQGLATDQILDGAPV
jgi:hypothetical protein